MAQPSQSEVKVQWIHAFPAINTYILIRKHIIITTWKSKSTQLNMTKSIENPAQSASKALPRHSSLDRNYT